MAFKCDEGYSTLCGQPKLADSPPLSVTAAAICNDAKAIDQFLQHGVDIDAVVDQEGNTLLHVAARHSSMDVVVKLYLAGADTSKLNQAWNRASQLLPQHQQVELTALEGAKAVSMPKGLGERYCSLIASMALDSGAQIPGCPEASPEICMRAYQRVGLVTTLVERLQAFRALIGDQCDDFTALVQYSDAAEITVTALKALLQATPLGGIGSTNGPVAAIQELLAVDGGLAAIVAVAGTAGIYPCPRNRDVGRKNLRCKGFRSILLSVSQTLALWVASPDDDARRACEVARRQLTRVLNLQLDRVANLLCLTSEGGWQEPIDMLMVAADACWSVEGAATRKRLLHNMQLKSILVQCLAALAAFCGQSESIKRCLPGLVRFLSKGVGSASPSDPTDLDAVRQLMCPDTISRCLATLHQFVHLSKEVKQGITDWDALQAQPEDSQAQKLKRCSAKQAAADSNPQANKEAALAAYYPDEKVPTSVLASSAAPPAVQEARTLLELFGRATADLVCALMDCSRVSPELLVALVCDGRVLDYIEAAAFTPVQAETWMRFLAAAMAPVSLSSPAENDAQPPQLAAEICDEMQQRLSQGKLQLLFKAFEMPSTSVGCQEAAMLLTSTLESRIPNWHIHCLRRNNSLCNKTLGSILIRASQSCAAQLASADEVDKRKGEAARQDFTKALNLQPELLQHLVCPATCGAQSEEGWKESMQMLLVAADACWGVHGAAARKQLLPNEQLRAVLNQCLADIALPCGPLGMPPGAKEKLQNNVPGLVRFLSDGVGSASASDPAEVDAVVQLLSPDLVARLFETMSVVARESSSLKAIIAEQETWLTEKKKNKKKKKPQDRTPAADLVLLGKVTADLLCALIDCSRVSPPLYMALVHEGRVVDYIEAATFTTEQATKWMQFLEAAVAPKPCAASSADRSLLQAAADLCLEIRQRRLLGKLEQLVNFPLDCLVTAPSDDCQRAALQLELALASCIPGWCHCTTRVALAGYLASTGSADKARWEAVLREALTKACWAIMMDSSERSFPKRESPLHVAMRVVKLQGDSLRSSAVFTLQPTTGIEALRLLAACLDNPLPDDTLPSRSMAVPVDRDTILATFMILTHPATASAAPAACQALHAIMGHAASGAALSSACRTMPAARQVYLKLVDLCTGGAGLRGLVVGTAVAEPPAPDQPLPGASGSHGPSKLPGCSRGRPEVPTCHILLGGGGCVVSAGLVAPANPADCVLLGISASSSARVPPTSHSLCQEPSADQTACWAVRVMTSMVTFRGQWALGAAGAAEREEVMFLRSKLGLIEAGGVPTLGADGVQALEELCGTVLRLVETLPSNSRGRKPLVGSSRGGVTVVWQDGREIITRPDWPSPDLPLVPVPDPQRQAKGGWISSRGVAARLLIYGLVVLVAVRMGA